MPKGKKKYKSGHQHSKLDSNILASEEESIADNCSVISNVSELKLGSDDDTLVDPDTEEGTIIDHFEDKLKDAIDGTTQKSAKARQNCLEAIRTALSKKYIFDFIIERKDTMCDVIERSLKRGKGEEQGIAALVSALVCTQLGAIEESDNIFQSVQPYLLVILTDPAVAATVRAKCAFSLGVCCFVASSRMEVVQSTMESLYSVFSASFLKGNGVPPTHSPDISSLHSTALLAWSLLLTSLSAPYVMDLCNVQFKRLPELLESSDLELRIAAGETIAIFYEIAREFREDFKGYQIDQLCEKLRLLATDGQKFRAKKDRKQQRSSFRDILKAVQEHECPDIRIKFGREILLINTWCHKRQYDAFCQLLGSGMNFHLMENELLRDIFELGAPLSFEGHLPSKSSKFERRIANVAASKARTKSRNKMRDKRADVGH